MTVPEQKCQTVPKTECNTVPREQCQEVCENIFWCKVCPQKTQPALSPEVEASCPPVPGGQATPGCGLTLIQDNYGQIDCQEDDDCPYRYSVFITSD